MANIQVIVEGNVNPFKQAMKEASAASRAFATEAGAQITGVGEGLKTVAGETGFGKLLKLMGAGGLAGAAITFGINLVNSFKEGIALAEDMQKVMARASAAFSPGEAFELKEWAERTAGGTPPEELISAATKIKQSGEGVTTEKAETVTTNLRGMAAFTGEHLDELVEMYAKGQAHDFTNLKKLVNGHPELRTILRQDLPQFPDIDKAAAAGEITPEMFDSVLAKENAPGGRFANAKLAMSQTTGGKARKADVQAGEVKEAFGEGALQGLGKMFDELAADLPKLKDQARALGVEFGELVTNTAKLAKYLRPDEANKGDRAMEAEGKIEDAFWHRIGDFLTGKNQPADSFKEMKEALHNSSQHLEKAAAGAEMAFHPG